MGTKTLPVSVDVLIFFSQKIDTSHRWIRDQTAEINMGTYIEKEAKY